MLSDNNSEMEQEKVCHTLKTPSDCDFNDRSETLNFYSQEMITDSLLDNSGVEKLIGD